MPGGPPGPAWVHPMLKHSGPLNTAAVNAQSAIWQWTARVRATARISRRAALETHYGSTAAGQCRNWCDPCWHNVGGLSACRFGSAAMWPGWLRDDVDGVGAWVAKGRWTVLPRAYSTNGVRHSVTSHPPPFQYKVRGLLLLVFGGMLFMPLNLPTKSTISTPEVRQNSEPNKTVPQPPCIRNGRKWLKEREKLG